MLPTSALYLSEPFIFVLLLSLQKFNGCEQIGECQHGSSHNVVRSCILIGNYMFNNVHVIILDS